jgi:hypothetical protein
MASRSMASSLSRHSMRVRSGSSSSGPLVPITAAAAAAAAEEAAAAAAGFASAPPPVQPVFEVEVLLDQDDEEPTLRISPNPAEFMVSRGLDTLHAWCAPSAPSALMHMWTDCMYVKPSGAAMCDSPGHSGRLA